VENVSPDEAIELAVRDDLKTSATTLGVFLLQHRLQTGNRR
jgi:hypothetical protein